MNTQRCPGTGRFVSYRSDHQRFEDRVEKLLTHPGYSRARAEQQAADELRLAHMVESDDV